MCDRDPVALRRDPFEGVSSVVIPFEGVRELRQGQRCGEWVGEAWRVRAVRASGLSPGLDLETRGGRNVRRRGERERVLWSSWVRVSVEVWADMLVGDIYLLYMSTAG